MDNMDFHPNNELEIPPFTTKNYVKIQNFLKNYIRNKKKTLTTA